MKQLLFLCALIGPLWAGAQDCTPEQYRKLIREADAAMERGQYDLAVNKLQSAKTCRPEQEAEVSEKIVAVFKKVNGERQAAIRNAEEARRQQERAEAETRRIFANDLAFKSQIALRDGDRTLAFRLAEFAQRYVESKNQNVSNALTQALYYNENSEHESILWQSNYVERHPGAVLCVKFSPDGKLLATGASDHKARIWDLSRGAFNQTFAGHEPTGLSFGIWSVALSPDGRFLATAAEDGTIKIWNTSGSAEAVMTLSDGASEAWSVAFSPDGKLIASGHRDNLARIWSLENRQMILSLSGHTSRVTSVAFLNDGTRLITGSDDRSARLWDLENGQVLQTFTGHEDQVASICLSPDNQYLATGSADKSIKIWRVSDGQIIQTLKGHNDVVASVCFSPNGEFLASGSWDNTAKIWLWERGNIVRAFDNPKESVRSVAFSPDGQQVVIGVNDGSIKIWNLNTDSPLQILRGDKGVFHNLSFLPDNRHLAASSNHAIKIWDTWSGDVMNTYKSDTEDDLSLCFSPNGQFAASITPDNTIKVRNIKDKALVATFEGHLKEVVNCLFSQDARQLVTVDSDHSLKIWNTQNGELIRDFSYPGIEVINICFSPDGDRLAIAANDNTVKILNINAGSIVQSLTGHEEGARTICFSPDGRFLASGGLWMVKIWDTQTEKFLPPLLDDEPFFEQNTAIIDLTFSPDGELLAAITLDQTIKIWDIKNQERPIVLQGAKSFGVGYDLAFSPDGKRLAVNADDHLAQMAFELVGEKTGSVTIWDLTSESWCASPIEKPQIAILRTRQLLENNLSGLLDLRPENESLLLATRETWQIAAFADLYAQKIAQTGFPQKSDYERALRLYQACLSHHVDDAYFERKIAGLEKAWAEK